MYYRELWEFSHFHIVHSYCLHITINKVAFTLNEARSTPSLMIFILETAQEPEIFTHFPSTVSYSTSNTELNRTPTRSTTRRSSIVSTTTSYTALNRALTSETYTQSSLSPYQDRPIGNILLNVSFTTFDSNSAQYSAAGVLIQSHDKAYATVNMHSVTFAQNQASSGSALSIIGNELHASLTMVSCNLTGNFHQVFSSLFLAKKACGAIYLEIESLDLLIMRHVNMTNNSGKIGGAITVSAKYVNSFTIVKTVIVDNTAEAPFDGNGGGIYLKISGSNPLLNIVNITDCFAKGNEASNMGGFLYMELDHHAASEIHILNCDIIGNCVVRGQGKAGGAIALVFKTVDSLNVVKHVFSINQCMFESNAAVEGGAIFLSVGIIDVDVIISSTNLIGNTVSHQGGALLLKYSLGNANRNDVRAKVTLKFENVNILANKANQIQGLGAGILILLDLINYEVDIGVINSNISNDVAHGSGGGLMLIVYPKKTHVTIINCTFVKNKAGKTGQGGALGVTLLDLPEQTQNLSHEFVLDIDKSKFLNNMAAQGGAIFQIFQEGGNFVNGSHSLFLNVSNSEFKCCEDDMEFESQNGTFIFSIMSADLQDLTVYENSHVADRLCDAHVIILYKLLLCISKSFIKIQ